MVNLISNAICTIMSSIIHEREQDEGDLERYTKRSRLEEGQPEDITAEKLVETDGLTEHQHILPPSHALLGVALPVAQESGQMNFLETDVGISEYIGRGVPKIEGIIKQR